MNQFYCAALLALILGGLSAACSSQAAEPTLCNANEMPIFSCKLKNKKTVSICASPDAVRGYVHYRFGTSSKVELTYSANADLPDHKFHRGEVVYANNADDVLWFTNGKYRYSVYSSMRGASGLTVSIQNDLLSRLECNNTRRSLQALPKTASPFILQHGSGDLSTFEKLWGEF